MTTYFTADQHFGHHNIIEYCGRPFHRVGEMNAVLVANWNAVVGPHDTVRVLGDGATGRREESMPLVGHLAGHKILHPGNHDRCWYGHGTRALRLEQEYLDAGFDEIRQGPLAMTVGNREVLVCPGQLDTTLDALEAAASSTDDAGQARAQAARRRVAECDTRLARYRAALEAGTDPVVVGAWIAEVQAERLAAEVELEQSTGGQRSRRMSRDQLAALVNGLGDLLGVLASATPEDKAEVYRRLGLRLLYDPTRRVVTVESHLGPDGSGALPRVARPSGGPTSGASAAEPVGESRCRRSDPYSTPTVVLRTELALAG